MLLNNLPIRLKLSLISLLPMLLALSFIGHDIKINLQTYTAMSQGQALGSLALQASELVHQLQRERGLSSGYLSSKGQRFSSQLPQQQQQTDQLHNQFKASLRSFDAKAYSHGLSQLLNRVSQQLSGLGQIRSQIRQRSINPASAISYYSNMNVQLLNITTEFSLLTDNVKISHATSSYYYFSMAKEQAGKERAILSQVFSQDSFNDTSFKAFIDVRTRANLYTEQFKLQSSANQKQQVASLLQGEATRAVSTLRDKALNQHDGFGVNPQQWFQAATRYIDQLKAAENYLSKELTQTVALQQQNATRQLITLAAIALVMSVLIITISLYIQARITRQISGLNHAINAVANNSDLTATAPVLSEDELGTLAQHFNAMVDHLRQLTHSITGAGTELQQMVHQVQGVASGVNTEVNQGLNQTTMIAAALEQMGLSVSEVASNCSEAASQSDQANSAATAGVSMVNDAHKSIEVLSDRIDNAMSVIDQVAADSEEIGSILDVITGIAEQTNLLALNAAIEAARAGDQGRGFAVVADEVRSLAHKTQDSSSRVQDMIEQLQNRSKEAVTAMKDSHARTGSTVEGFSQVLQQLENITHQSSNVNQMNLQNAAATEQQSATVNEINVNIQDVQHSYNETNHKVSDLNQSAQRLEELSLMLTSEVKQFKT